ncbi:MAG TPA: hypothetical protein VHE61_06040 [Opitutaceae bacterium]|nr:hypothetical protein [Opitutaceae bacterium]
MRPKSIVVVALLATAALSVLAWRQHLELVQLRGTALAGGDRAALEAQLAKLRNRNRDLEAKIRALHSASTDGGVKTPDEKDAKRKTLAAALLARLGVPGGANGNENLKTELLAALSDLPEFQKLVALQQRGAIDGKYAALFHQLNLNPEQRQQFASLLADRQSAFADALLAAHDQGLTGEEARQMALTVARATQKDIDSSMQALLGPQGYSDYQNYQRTMPQRETVNQLQQRLNADGASLTPQQQNQLVQVLAKTAKQQAAATVAAAAASGEKIPKPRTTMPPVPGPLRGIGIASSNSGIITSSAVSTSGSFLSPQQVGALQQLQQEQQAQINLTQIVKAGLHHPAPPPPPPAGSTPSGKG